MKPKTLHESSTRLLSRRESEESVPRNRSTDETEDYSVVKTEVITITSNSSNELNNRRFSKSPIIFEPLDEDGERYLQEHMGLPPIDLTAMPTRYYVNPHPTESIMSSGANSANEWWYKVDYSDEEDGELECARDGRKDRLIRRHPGKTRETVHTPPESPGRKTFPKTLEMQRERKVRELLEEEERRNEIISKLEKQMVSLYNLKRQYKRTLVGEGCTRARAPSLPPVGVGVGVVADDKLARQRDSILSRIKRKKLEDEIKRKKQIERKINIVKTILNEQKQKEKELKRKINEVIKFNKAKQKKTKEESRTNLLDEFDETSHDSVGPDVLEDVTPTEDTVADDIGLLDTGLVEGAIGSQFPPDEVSPVSDDLLELETPEQSPRKSSKSKNARKKKSSETSTKQDRKTKKGKKKKDTMETEETPAICEPPAELPASQVAELSLWFDNWRENISEQNRWDQPEESEVALKPSKIVFKDVVAGRRSQQVVVITNMGLGVLQCRVVGVQLLTFTDNDPLFQAALSGPSRARTGQSWSLTVTLDPLEDVGDGTAEVLMLCCRGEATTRFSVEVQVLTPRAAPALSIGVIKFGPQMFWCRDPIIKHLEICNPGGLSCHVHWTEVVERISPLCATDSLSLEENVRSEERVTGVSSEQEAGGSSRQVAGVASEEAAGVASEQAVSEQGAGDSSEQITGVASEQATGVASEQVTGVASEQAVGGSSKQGAGDSSEQVEGGSSEQVAGVANEQNATGKGIIAKYILKSAIKNVFRTFRIDAQQPVFLQPKSQVSLPVKFVPAMSPDLGDVFVKYKFYFEGENVENESQDLVICGKIERSPFRLEYEVVNMKLCYAGGAVQQGRLTVLSSARHACHVKARVPRSLAAVVSVVPSSAVVAADSYVVLAVRLVLGWDFLDKPSRYLDSNIGLLMFPLSVLVTDLRAPGAPPLEATVVATVAPPCPLTLEPPVVELGAVTTMETVEAELRLSNHSSRAYSYAFVDLPPSVMIEPGAGTGSVLPLETVKLKLLFSPRAQDLGVDCGRPGGEGEVSLTLRCFTTVSLASPIRIQQRQKDKLAQQESLTNNNGISTSYTVSLHSSRPPSKRLSREGSLQYSDEEKRHNESRKVAFEERSLKSTSEGSFVYVPVNNYESEEMEGEELEEEKGYGDDYLTISEIKEEVDEVAPEELWDFYSTFQFDKCSTDGRNQGRSEKETKEGNEEENYENESASGKNEVRESNEDIETDKERSTQPVIEGRSSANLKEGDVSIKEKAGVINDSENYDKNETFENDFSVHEVDLDDKSDSHDSGSEKGEMHEKDSKDVCLLPGTSQRFATVSVKAYVTDPLVELSSQSVVLPPAPLTSYSIAHIYLRNRLQRPCSIHDKITKYKTRFEFRSPSKDLIVEPKNGIMSCKQSQKISLIYRPTLSGKAISDKALEMKVENLKWQKMQDMLNDYNKLKESKKPKVKFSDKNVEEEVKPVAKSQSDKGKSKKGKEKKSKGSVVSVKTKKTKDSLKGSKLRKKSSGPLPEVVINPADVTVQREDLSSAEMSMLKYLEPYQETLTLSCLLETDVGDGNSHRRQETLRCDVLCSVVAPNIFLSSPACLDFGPVALGTSSRMEATVTNISFFDAFVRLSTLNPVGPFSCPAHLERPFWKGGELELPPEHILTVPIRFQPTESSEVVEAFEVVSGSTVLHLQARGRGVSPSFTFHPDQEVFMVTSGAGKKADITISISNKSEASLTFRISLEYLKEGQSLPAPTEEQAPSSPASPKQKKSPKKEKKAKGLPEFTVLSEELEKCLENDFIDVENTENTEPVIKILNADENITILSGETKQVILRFTPPALKQGVDVSESPKSAKGSRKGSPEGSKKTKNKKADKQDTATVNTKLDKKGGKKKGSSVGKEDNRKDSPSEKSDKKMDVKIKQIFAARFSVVLADTYKVKDWVVLGTKK